MAGISVVGPEGGYAFTGRHYNLMTRYDFGRRDRWSQKSGDRR
jgi:hypothetical protein